MRKKADLANMVGISTAESQSQRVETILIEPRSFSQSQCSQSAASLILPFLFAIVWALCTCQLYVPPLYPRTWCVIVTVHSCKTRCMTHTSVTFVTDITLNMTHTSQNIDTQHAKIDAHQSQK